MGGSHGGGSRLARCEVSVNASRRLPRRIMTIQQATSSARTGLPRQVSLAGGHVVVLRTMKRWDRHAVTTFVRTLPSDARLVMPMDITDEVAADEWIAALESGRAFNVLACEGDQLIGYAGLRRGTTAWTQHLGEFSLLVRSGWPTIELGQHLCRELVRVALDLGLRKIVTQIRSDDEDARVIFSDAGFRPEALLVDQVIDEDARTYDLLIMSCARDQFIAIMMREMPVIAAAEKEAEPRGAAPAVVLLLAARASAPIGAARGDVDVAEPAAAAAVEAPMMVPADTRPSAEPPSGALEAAEPPAVVSVVVSPRRPARAAPTRRGYYLVAAVLGVTLVLALGAAYWSSRSTGAAPVRVLGASARPPATIARGPAFEASHRGSGGVFLPVVPPALRVRVVVEPGAVRAWFWCIESSFGLPLEEHACGNAATAERQPDGLVTQATVHIDPAWPADAMYFVQMFCESPCVWDVQVASE